MASCRDCFHWKACKEMLEAQGYSVSEDFQGSAERCDTFVNAADVVPKREFAEEIFAEIEDMIKYFTVPNDCALVSLTALAELKKKYTEGATNERAD